MSDLVWHVFFVALLTDLATGLGALPFVFVRRLSDRWQGIAYATAGGMMISASVFSLADQGIRRGSVLEIIVGLLAGAVFYWWTAKHIEQKDWRIENLSAQDSRQSVLMVATMFIHSIPEGMAIGVGYATGEYEFGLLLAMAIAIHNVPEGIAISLPLKAKNVSTFKCALYAIFSSLPQPIVAVPAFLIVWLFQPLLPIGLGFAGGAMIFLANMELLPSALERCSRVETSWGVMVGLVVMLGLTSGMGL